MTTIKIFLHKSFIPGKHNSWRPHALRHHLLFVYYVGLIVSQLNFSIATYSPTSTDTASLKGSVFTSINKEREKSSLSLLRENEMLSRAAKEKLEDMFEKNYWDHTSPTGEKAWVFINGAGYSYSVAGENLAKGFTSNESMVSAWMKSPTHRENILNEKYRDTGIAVANGKIGGTLTTVVVQIFGAPAYSYASSQEAMVAGEKSVSPSLNLKNVTEKERAPFLLIYLVLFVLVVFDGIMVRINKTHRNKKTMLAFRSSLALSFVALAFLAVNITYIS